MTWIIEWSMYGQNINTKLREQLQMNLKHDFFCNYYTTNNAKCAIGITIVGNVNVK